MRWQEPPALQAGIIGIVVHVRAKPELAIREKALGPEHPDVAKSLNNLARLLPEQRSIRESQIAL